MRSIVEKINPLKLSEVAERIKEKPLSLKEIVKEEHKFIRKTHVVRNRIFKEAT